MIWSVRLRSYIIYMEEIPNQQGKIITPVAAEIPTPASALGFTLTNGCDGYKLFLTFVDAQERKKSFAHGRNKNGQ